MRIDDTLWCDGCGAEIYWAPVVVNRKHYCCQDCAEGRECACGTMIELDDERRTGVEQAAGGYE